MATDEEKTPLLKVPDKEDGCDRLSSGEGIVSSDDEMADVDPFRHRIKMSKLRWLRTYLLTPILIPLRFSLLLVVTSIAWFVSYISLWGLSEEEKISKPISGWRKTTQRICSLMGRLAFRATGFHSIQTKGQLASPEEAPVLVVAPHSTFLDGFVVFWCGLPYIVSRQENKSLMLLGKCIEFAQSLFVSREDPLSRQKTVKEIIRRSQDHEVKWPQLLIFPEGSTSNRKALMTFKPGAFVPGKPVQPILIRYPNDVDTVTWTWNQPHGARSVMWLTLTQVYNRASLEFLPVYNPSQAEIDDPKLYARNVRQVMADALHVPTNDLSYEEVKRLYGKKYKQKHRHKDD